MITVSATDIDGQIIVLNCASLRGPAKKQEITWFEE